MSEDMKKTIVSADDDPVIRELVKAILEADGYDVVSVEDGVAVFEDMEEGGYLDNICCFVLDIEMPRMNGLDVLTKLKLSRQTQHIPVILLTAQSQSSDLVRSYSCSAEHYILKPFTRQQLLDGVEMALNQL